MYLSPRLQVQRLFYLPGPQRRIFAMNTTSKHTMSSLTNIYLPVWGSILIAVLITMGVVGLATECRFRRRNAYRKELDETDAVEFSVEDVELGMIGDGTFGEEEEEEEEEEEKEEEEEEEKAAAGETERR
ncbi:MAG: hypothetical protein MMC33_007160 [Icmadophila ericetorum]|nr:hypothetical protein [Icmadophila ericetorum]